VREIYGSEPAGPRPPLTAGWAHQAQQAAGNQAVVRAIQRAEPPAAPPSGAGPPAQTSPRRPVLDRHDLTMMEEDVDEVRDALTGKWISDEDEARALRRVQKWAARDESFRARTGYEGTDHLDKFLFLLKTRTVSVSGVRTAWVEQMTNVFDLYFEELDGARLSEFKRLVASSRTQAAEGRTSERSESAWSFVGKREALGVMGMVKGLSTSAAGLADLGAWALGADVSGGGLAGEVGKGWDDMAAAAAGAMSVDINEAAVLGQSSFAVGDIGGKVIGALTTAGAVSGASVAAQAGVAAVQTAKGIDDLGIALAKLRRGPPALPWSEISRRPDVWAKVVGVVASATGMVGSAHAAHAAVKEACDTLGIVLGGGQVVVLVAAYRAVDQDRTIASPPERLQRKADLLAEIASTGALTIDSRYGQPFRKLWETNHATVLGPERSAGSGPGKGTPSAPVAPVGTTAEPIGAVPEPIAHSTPTAHGPSAPEAGGGGGGGGGGRDAHADTKLGGGTVLEPHPGGHEHEPEFIPGDADLPDRGTGTRDELFGMPTSRVENHADVEARLNEMVMNNLSGKQKTATTPGRGVVAAGELHLEGQHGPEHFVEKSGGAGVGAPDAVHVLRGEEVPLPDQLVGEVIPSRPESQVTTGVDEAFPSARQRHEARHKEYLAANQATHEHPGPRSHDAEKKILDRASARLADNPTATGELHVMPSHPPCPACMAAIFAFRGDHPHVDVFLYRFKP
jgi:hypothetical protein